MPILYPDEWYMSGAPAAQELSLHAMTAITTTFQPHRSDRPQKRSDGRWICLGLLIVAVFAAAAQAAIPASAYVARRAAALTAIRGDLLIVPARASFLADDQLGFVQATDFQYLTGLDELVGAVLVLDGSTSTSILFVAPRNPLLTRAAIEPGAASTK
jgi:hypothetical protein